GVPALPELPRRRAPSARAFRITLAGATVAWWVIYPILMLATGDAFSLAYGLVISSLLALLVAQWFGMFWLMWAIDYWERVRVPRVRHLVVHLAIQQADQPGGAGPTPREVWDDLASLIAAQAGVSVQEIHPAQHFGELPDYC